MGIFDMGMGEILLVIVVALIIWGPNKLPEIARTVGKAVATLRKTSFDLTAEIRKELDRVETDSPSQEIKKEPEIEKTDSPSQPEINEVIKTGESQDTGTSEAGDTEQANPKDR